MPFPFKTYALCAYLLHTAWEVYLSYISLFIYNVIYISSKRRDA
jgi:hypothetical protein